MLQRQPTTTTEPGRHSWRVHVLQGKIPHNTMKVSCAATKIQRRQINKCIGLKGKKKRCEEYYSVIKRVKFCHFQQCAWTHSVFCLIKLVRQRKIYTLYVIIHMWKLKNKTNAYNKKKNRLTDNENKEVANSGEEKEGIR